MTAIATRRGIRDGRALPVTYPADALARATEFTTLSLSGGDMSPMRWRGAIIAGPRDNPKGAAEHGMELWGCTRARDCHPTEAEALACAERELAAHKSDSPGFADHPVADMFPLMDPESLAELADDIKKHGLKHPIVLHQNRILDGRNRYRACHIAGIEPHFKEFGDGFGRMDPLAFVVTENLKRRHLSTEQRAAIGLKLLPKFEAEAKARQQASRIKGGKPPADGGGNLATTGKARDQAAAAVGISGRTLQKAKARAAQRPYTPRLRVVPPANDDNAANPGDVADLRAWVSRIAGIATAYSRLGDRDALWDRVVAEASSDTLRHWDQSITRTIGMVRSLRAAINRDRQRKAVTHDR